MKKHIIYLFDFYASLGISPFYYHLTLTKKKKKLFAQNIYNIDRISMYW